MQRFQAINEFPQNISIREEADNELWSDEMPQEARELIEQTDKALGVIQNQLTLDVAEIHKKAEAQTEEIQRSADQKMKRHRQGLFEKLKPMMEAYARSGKLEEALALRSYLRPLRAEALGIRPDPGCLFGYENDIGKSFVFEVVGSSMGPVWGTEIYTADSNLSTAAVHAGLLRPDEKGLVRATLVDMSNRINEGCQRNGVMSHPWGAYPYGYRLARA